MKRYENQCCGCSTSGYPCMGEACPNRNVLVVSCDECGSEEDIYFIDGKELCSECILKQYKKIS